MLKIDPTLQPTMRQSSPEEFIVLILAHLVREMPDKVRGIPAHLQYRQIEVARSLPGIRRILGVTRPARYHKRATLSIEQYVVLRSASGRLIDPVLAFHLDYGAHLVTTLPGFRPEDRDSLGYGVLIEYPVHVESAHNRT